VTSVQGYATISRLTNPPRSLRSTQLKRRSKDDITRWQLQDDVKGRVDGYKRNLHET